MMHVQTDFGLDIIQSSAANRTPRIHLSTKYVDILYIRWNVHVIIRKQLNGRINLKTLLGFAGCVWRACLMSNACRWVLLGGWHTSATQYAAVG